MPRSTCGGFVSLPQQPARRPKFAVRPRSCGSDLAFDMERTLPAQHVWGAGPHRQSTTTVSLASRLGPRGHVGFHLRHFGPNVSCTRSHPHCVGLDIPETVTALKGGRVPRHVHWNPGHRRGHALVVDVREFVLGHCIPCAQIWRLRYGLRPRGNAGSLSAESAGRGRHSLGRGRVQLENAASLTG